MNPSNPREQRIKYIKNAISRLDTMVDTIQKVRRLSQMQLIDMSSLVRLDLASVVRSQVSRAIGNAPDKKVRMLYENIPDDCFVLANDLIGELFNDILIYSLRYNYSESPELLISISELNDEFNNRKYWDVAIADNGPGILDEKKALLFEINSRSAGEGLPDISLFAVKSIVNLYGGRIWVDDRISGESSSGSVFHVLLPAA